MERYITSVNTKGKKPRLPIPSFVRRLVYKILAGDTDAIGLLATPQSSLLFNQTENSRNLSDFSRILQRFPEIFQNFSNFPRIFSEYSTETIKPTAIKADYYSYTFSSWDDLWNKGIWWNRRRLSKSQVFSVYDTSVSVGDIRRTPWHRGWIMVVCCCLIWISLQRFKHKNTVFRPALSLIFALFIVHLALVADYPNHAQNFRTFLEFSINSAARFLEISWRSFLRNTGGHWETYGGGDSGVHIPTSWFRQVACMIGASGAASYDRIIEGSLALILLYLTVWVWGYLRNFSNKNQKNVSNFESVIPEIALTLTMAMLAAQASEQSRILSPSSAEVSGC
ncbi:hypothetical protein AAMO2058_000082200 [Amorphochlora amoebiformis]